MEKKIQDNVFKVTDKKLKNELQILLDIDNF